MCVSLYIIFYPNVPLLKSHFSLSYGIPDPLKQLFLCIIFVFIYPLNKQIGLFLIHNFYQSKPNMYIVLCREVSPEFAVSLDDFVVVKVLCSNEHSPVTHFYPFVKKQLQRGIFNVYLH